ncbi:MAG: tetratricopeptide repeat protein [Cyclobacteriaceae bacterium]
MLNINPIPAGLANQSRQFFLIFYILLIALSSCSEETSEGLANDEINSNFDTEFELVLEIMDERPMLALKKLNTLVMEAENTNSKYYSGKAKWYMGYIYDEVLEDVSLAYHNYNEALKDVEESEDSSLKMKIYNNLGILYRYYKQYDAAINNYESAIRLKDDLTINQLSDVYYNYGVALKLKGDSISFFNAERAFSQSLEYAHQIDYHENIASVHNQIGLMYKAVENYEMSRIAYNNTIRSYINNTDLQDYVGKAYHGIGVTYMDEMNVEAAVDAFEKALKYKRSSGSIFITKYDMGTVLMNDGQVDRAISIWKDALNEKHNRNSIEQVKIYSDLTSALKANDQYKEALAYSEVYNSNVQNILAEGEKYKSKSDVVLFANVVKDYDEFNKPLPFFARPMMLLLSILVIAAMFYLSVFLYYRYKSNKTVSHAISRIQTEFLEIKVD